MESWPEYGNIQYIILLTFIRQTTGYDAKAAVMYLAAGKDVNDNYK